MNEEKTLQAAIIKVLMSHNWYGYWHGYEFLSEEIEEMKIPTLKKFYLKKELIKEIRELKKLGLVEVRTCFTDEMKFAGKGWFVISKFREPKLCLQKAIELGILNSHGQIESEKK